MEFFKNKKDEDIQGRHNRLLGFTIIILIMFIVIMIFEVIFVDNYIVNYNYPGIEDNNININNNIPSIDTSKLTFTEVNLNESNNYINDKCVNGCNLKVKIDNEDFFYIIEKNSSNNYVLSIVNNNKYLYKKSIGKNLDNAYLRTYLSNILFYVKYSDDSFTYDYAVITSKYRSIDEFTSLEANEMEFLNDGVVYYYDVCKNISGGNALKVKATRLPFSKNKPRELGQEVKTYSWCSR